MTCIAALRQNGNIYMACDSAWTTGRYEDVIISSDGPRKIIGIPVANTDDQVLIAVAGDGGVLCELALEFEDVVFESTPSFREVRSRIDKILDELDLWKPFESGGNNHTVVLVAIQNQLFRIENKNAWLEVNEKFQAIGSGADLAVGALEGLSVEPFSPVAHLLNALEIVARYDWLVKKPFHVISTRVLRDEEK